MGWQHVLRRGRMARLLVRGAWSRPPWPPGPLIRLDQCEKADRRFLLAHAAQHGPIFKALAGDDFWVCIVGLSKAQRFLNEHGSRARPVTMELGHLFPRGFLRQMTGDDHATYRKTLTQAVRAADVGVLRPDLEAIAARGLDELCHPHEVEHPHASGRWVEVLTEMATAMLIRFFYGATPGTEFHEVLRAGYRKLGPHGLIWHPGPAQEQAFQFLQEEVRRSLGSTGRMTGGVAWHIAQAGQLDDTMLGNLIYMVEMGRYDLHGLFRWLTRYAGECPDVLNLHAPGGPPAPAAGENRVRAFVLETLRMDQSERLLRRMEADAVFDGYLIPRGAMVRLCLWEAHKDEDIFPQPFRFSPQRFITCPPGRDQFAPFGLDHHHCPLAAVSLHLGEAYVRTLARDFQVTVVNDGPPVRGPYHWETSPALTLHLRRRKSS